MSIGSDLLDAALRLSSGEKLEILCCDRKELQVVKVSLYRERKRYEAEAGPLAESICIEQESLGEGRFLVRLSLAPQASRFQAQVVKPTGEAIPVVITRAVPGAVKEAETTCHQTVGQSSDKTRIIALMKEDGLTDEEIKEILGREEMENGNSNDSSDSDSDDPTEA